MVIQDNKNNVLLIAYISKTILHKIKAILILLKGWGVKNHYKMLLTCYLNFKNLNELKIKKDK